MSTYDYSTETSLNRQYLDYEVQDVKGDKFGHIHHLWTDEAGNPQFIGVTTGWLFERHYIIPTDQAEVNDSRKTIRLPYSKDYIKEAPSFVDSEELAEADRASIRSHYTAWEGAQELPSQVPTTPSSLRQERMSDESTIPLKEEQLKVGKREVEAGSVRLRKIVRTETVSEPVELRHDEVVIERVPGSQQATDSKFREEDIFIPLRREEAVIQKTARVTEEVRVGKKSEVERQTVSEQVRKEELKVDRDVTRDNKKIT